MFFRAKAEDGYGKALLGSCKLSPEMTETGCVHILVFLYLQVWNN